MAAIVKDVNEELTDLVSMEFDGDIIITDPCYLIPNDKNIVSDDDWKVCGYGSNMNALGINHCIVHDTLYGDWGCTTYDMKTGNEIGQFCADAGLVGVFLLDEVLGYNPEFDYHIKRDWTTTLIKNFCGKVQIKVAEVKDEDGDDDEVCYVEGHGIDKETGKAIDFITYQTSL